LFPNPATNVLNVVVPALSKNFDVEICDVTGKQVLVSKMEISGAIDISMLRSGVYFVKITSENKALTTKKFIKE